MKRGFTLAEVIIALLVVVVVMAASASIITQKTRVDLSQQTGQPWEWIGNTSNAKYNSGGDDRSLLVGLGGLNANPRPRMAIRTVDNYIDDIAYYQNGLKKGALTVNNKGYFLGDSPYLTSIGGFGANVSNAAAVGIGSVRVYGRNSVNIGQNTLTMSRDVAIGNNAASLIYDSIAIGNSATTAPQCTFNSETNELDCHVSDKQQTYTSMGIAIGSGAKSMMESIAIGTAANASKYTPPQVKNALALGYGATAVGNQIFVIGNNSTFNMAKGSNYVNNVILISHNTNMTSTTSNTYTCKYSGSNHSIDANNTVIIGGNSSVVLNGNTVTAKTIYANAIYANSITSSNYTAPSDLRLKNIIGEYTSGIDKLNKLKIYNYTFKADPSKQRVGVIAQQLMKIFPDAVSKDEDGYYMIRQEDIFYSMVNALKEFDKKIKNIMTSISNINKDMADMELRVENLSKQTEYNAQEIKLLKQRVKNLELKVDSLKNKKSEVTE
ncbi:tail fiber domain-containing protein [bacterium]|nr:tail fiber domain-containing protein [bacterium]